MNRSPTTQDMVASPTEGTEHQADRRARRGSWQHLVASDVHHVTSEVTLCEGCRRTGGRSRGSREWRHHLSNAQCFLEDASTALAQRSTPMSWYTASHQESAYIALHHAVAEEVYLLPDDLLAARLPMLIDHATHELGSSDERVQMVRRISGRHVHPVHWNGVTAHRSFDAHDRAAIAEMVHDAYAAADERYAASRSYRNRLIRLILIALAVLGVMLTVAALAPWDPLLAEAGVGTNGPAEGNVPSEGVLFGSVALMGAVGGFLSGIWSVARTRGTRNPFSLPTYQMLLKLPVGGLAAVVGVLALQAGFVGEVTTSATGLLVWAIAFGASQQGITHLVDRRVQDLVSSEPSDLDADGPAGTGSVSSATGEPRATSETGQAAGR